MANGWLTVLTKVLTMLTSVVTNVLTMVGIDRLLVSHMQMLVSNMQFASDSNGGVAQWWIARLACEEYQDQPG